MRPSYFLAFFAAIGLTLLGMLVFDRPARADGPDAGVAVPAGAVASSPVTVELPTPKTPAPPDALEHPAEAISAVTDTYKHSGIWASVMMALWILFQIAGKNSGPGTFLGDSRWTAGFPALIAFAGSGVDALTLHPPNAWFVVASCAVMGLALVLRPHVSHAKPAKGFVGGG